MVILAFGLVYLFWGSTYLAIAISVEHIPPALMCATRFLIAGILMLAYCAVRGRRVMYSTRQLWQMAVIGTLLCIVTIKFFDGLGQFLDQQGFKFR